MGIAYNPSAVSAGLAFSVDFNNIKNINGTTLTDVFKYPITISNVASNTLTVSNGYAEFNPTDLTSAATFYSISNTYFNTIASEMSVETTIYPIESLGGTANYVRPISPRVTETGSPLGFGLGTSSITTEINTTTGWNVAGTSSAQITGYNKWYHIVQTTSVATFTMRTYINGVLVRNQPFTGTPNGGGGFLIGRGYYGGVANYKGRVGIFKVYNRALTDAEVQQNFTSVRGRYGL